MKIAIEDCYRACAQAKARGGRNTREAGPLEGSGEAIAFVEDPDGYRVELIERP